jgi:hypothetical protein
LSTKYTHLPEPVGDLGELVSTIDVKTKTKHPTDISVGSRPSEVAVTPCRQ